MKNVITFCCLAILCSLNLSASSSYHKAVSELLTPDELFIQFREVYTFNGYATLTGHYEYAAIIVDPEADEATIKYMFTSTSLHKYERTDCNNAELGKLVWDNLQDEFKGKSKIYMATSGELNNYPVEYLPTPANPNHQMNEDYTIYRTSGIAALANRTKKADRQRKAVIFGGLEYDLNTNDTTSTDESKLLAFRNGRMKLQELPETKIEAQFIDSILRKDNIPVALQSGKDGTEESFKDIPTSGANLIHMATHGFYDPQYYMDKNDGIRKWMMSRVGVCMSGGNTKEDKYDGIITGSDISSMDMKNMNLVVLSACQTGLGDVFEGHQYGMATAFKYSGAKSILASLWSVNDAATRILMTGFYSNLSNGDEPLYALKKAQESVRKYEIIKNSNDNLTPYQRLKLEKRGNSHRKDTIRSAPYSAPQYWAAFVLIDAFPKKENIISDATIAWIKEFESRNLLGAFIDDDVANWEKHKDKLSENDALIYFYNYTLPTGDDEYVALIYSKDNTEGTIFQLCRFPGNQILPHTEWQNFSDKIFKKLEPYINRKTKIYFRPTGVFTKLPVENLWEYMHPEKNISFYRISSGETLEMIGKAKGITYNNAVLYGGLNYGYHIAYLPGSKKEVTEIESLMVSKGTNTVCLTGDNGTEQSFRNLSGKEIGILHIASVSQNYNLKSFPIEEHTLEECLLQRSALVFAGTGNDNFDLNAINKLENDGALFANEISRLDFKNVDFIALSSPNSLYSASTSCLDYGLARGFRKAGAKSILGSLTNIDDNSTQMLMTEFYRQLLSGKSKHDALKLAQALVRDFETHDGRQKPYESPLYWAAFVLLDAVE